MASLFFDYQCQGTGAKEGVATTTLAWCKSENILAVATDDGQINFYQEEGALVEPALISRDKKKACAAEWQPKGRRLALGWNDGQISVWNVMDTLQENHSTCVCVNGAAHKHPITFLRWNPSGNRLLTGDKGGVVCVWKADNRGSIALAVQYRKSSPLTTAIFCGSRQQRSDALAQAFSPSFFFGTEAGTVCYADDLGHCSDVQQLTSCVDSMTFHEEEMRLVIITRSLLMTQLQVSEDGKVTRFAKVKLSVSANAVSENGVREVVWAGPGLLAAATGENLVRFWDLPNDENYVLLLSGAGLEKADRAISVHFNPVQRYLAVGTKDGHVAMWRFGGDYGKEATMQRPPGAKEFKGPPVKYGKPTSAEDWETLPTVSVGDPVTAVQWGPGTGLLAAATKRGATCILGETVLHRRLSDGVAAIQLSINTLSIEHESDRDHHRDPADKVVRTHINIKELALQGQTLVVLSGKEAQVIRIRGPQQAPDVREPFPCPARAAAVDERREQIFMAEDSKIQIYNTSGGFKSAISFTEGEGSPCLLDLNGTSLVVATDKGIIKMFDVSKKEQKEGLQLPVRQLNSAGRFVDPATGESLGAMRSVRCNGDGTRVSILSDRVHGQTLKIREPDMRLHVYDADKDVVVSYDFGAQRRYPTSHFWDSQESKLLAVETQRLRGGQMAGGAAKGTGKGPDAPRTVQSKSSRDGGEGKTEAGGRYGDDSAVAAAADRSAKARSAAMHDMDVMDAEVTTMFVTTDHGILMQDSFPLEPPLQSLVGLQVPRLYFATKTAEQAAPTLMSRTMRDFLGLDQVDEKTTQALLDFSFFLTVGDMDRAYGAVRLIRNPSVWENMAHMCVKTKRLDVAEVCLGNMGHARGAAAVRLAKAEPEVEARVAQVAIQLGLLDDAVKLYRECQRFDLLNRLYQAAGLWDRALDEAHAHDRMNLRTTHQLYAQHLEKVGDVTGAIGHYEQADTYRTEVPRMLFEKSRVDDLEDYITTGDDSELLKWWAQYCESIGSFDKARRYYARSDDHLSLVRLACYVRDFQQAANIVQDSGSPLAAYHLARQFEGMGEIQDAVSFYSQSGCYNHAIRLAKAYGMDSELMGFAIKSRPSLMVEVAGYFEAKGEYEKAVQLYQKGGDLPKALDLCFKAGTEGRPAMFEVLKTIAEDLSGQDASPQVLAKCAQFFIEHDQFQKASQLYIQGRRYREAIALCVSNKVPITEEMAESLSPPKPEGKGAEGGEEKDDPKSKRETEERNAVLRELAEACKKQGNFHLACKKYTQSGDRLKAMKCLLKSGDTKNITYYASVSRHRDIYILAANYLQNLDWHNNAEIMKAIVTFYTKAKAFEQLGGFYDACAQVEIDEYRNYDKALGALNEAVKHYSKAKSPESRQLLAALQHRIQLVEEFAQARSVAESNPLEMVRICQQLLEQPDIEAAIRVGDCFSALVDYYHAHKDWQQCYSLIERMRERGIVLHLYLEQEVVVEVYQAVGVGLEQMQRRASGRPEQAYADDDVGEDIPEDNPGEELDESLGDESDEGKDGRYK